jgi:hypothetical protein
MSNVIYLNRYLNCPDIILRRNYEMQIKISEARVHFFYKVREEGHTESKAKYLYSVWVQKNRNRIKLCSSHQEELTSSPA